MTEEMRFKAVLVYKNGKNLRLTIPGFIDEKGHTHIPESVTVEGNLFLLDRVNSDRELFYYKESNGVPFRMDLH